MTGLACGRAPGSPTFTITLFYHLSQTAHGPLRLARRPRQDQTQEEGLPAGHAGPLLDAYADGHGRRHARRAATHTACHAAREPAHTLQHLRRRLLVLSAASPRRDRAPAVVAATRAVAVAVLPWAACCTAPGMPTALTFTFYSFHSSAPSCPAPHTHTIPTTTTFPPPRIPSLARLYSLRTACPQPSGFTAQRTALCQRRGRQVPYAKPIGSFWRAARRWTLLAGWNRTALVGMVWAREPETRVANLTHLH